MFSFLSRKQAPSNDGQSDANDSANNHMELIQKNLYDAVMHRRVDIVISLLNEWFKGK